MVVTNRHKDHATSVAVALVLHVIQQQYSICRPYIVLISEDTEADGVQLTEKSRLSKCHLKVSIAKIQYTCTAETQTSVVVMTSYIYRDLAK